MGDMMSENKVIDSLLPRNRPRSDNHEGRHYIVLWSRVQTSLAILLNTARFSVAFPLSSDQIRRIETIIRSLDSETLSCDEAIAEVRAALKGNAILWRKFLGSLRMNTIWKDVAGDGSGHFP